MADDIVMRAFALIIAEHEVMRKKLTEMGEIHETAPLRWKSDGKPIVSLEKAVNEFMQNKKANDVLDDLCDTE